MDASRDWGHAADYVKGMHMMLQAKESDTFVLATGKTHQIRDFKIAFEYVDVEIVFEGKGLNEVGRDSKSNKIVLEIDPKFFRPSEVDIFLKGDYRKAYKKFGWKPSIDFKSSVYSMMEEDLKRNSYVFEVKGSLTGADGFTGKHLFNHLENNEYKCIPQSNLLSKRIP